MIARIVTLEGLQPMVAEASVFLREIEQCRDLPIETGKSIVVITIIGFAAMAFAMWKLYKHFEHTYAEVYSSTK